jgi:hypothetical protein
MLGWLQRRELWHLRRWILQHGSNSFSGSALHCLSTWQHHVWVNHEQGRCSSGMHRCGDRAQTCSMTPPMTALSLTKPYMQILCATYHTISYSRHELLTAKTVHYVQQQVHSLHRCACCPSRRTLPTAVVGSLAVCMQNNLSMLRFDRNALPESARPGSCAEGVRGTATCLWPLARRLLNVVQCTRP